MLVGFGLCVLRIFEYKTRSIKGKIWIHIHLINYIKTSTNTPWIEIYKHTCFRCSRIYVKHLKNVKSSHAGVS